MGDLEWYHEIRVDMTKTGIRTATGREIRTLEVKRDECRDEDVCSLVAWWMGE